MFKFLHNLRTISGTNPQSALTGPIMTNAQDAQKAAYPSPDSGYTPPPVAGPLPTSLTLSPDRLTWLIEEWIKPRIAELKLEMGLQADGSAEPMSWMGIRVRNQDTYDNNLEWRKSLGGIFNTGNNFTMGTNRRYARLLSARVRADLLGTKPFFGAMTAANGDPTLTKQVEDYLQDEIDESNVPDALRDALRIALVRNEAVVKTTYLLDQTDYVGPARVLVDQMGRAIMTPLKKLYINESDDFVTSPDTQGVQVLEKDPSFQMQQGQYGYQTVPNLLQHLIRYDGAHSDVLDPRDFLCPLKVRTTDEADINVHLFHENPDNLRGTFKGLKPSEDYYARRTGDTGREKPVYVQGERITAHSKVLSRVLMGDVYCRVDQGMLLTGTSNGRAVELWVLMDMDNDDAIFYDYLGNHMSKRPFSVIPGIERVPGRWYGVGVFTKMEHAGLYIDLQFNRGNEKDSQNSTCTFRVPRAVKQWKNGEKVKFGSREVYDCEPGFDEKNKPLFRVNLGADAELDLKLMDRMQQAGDLEFAVISSRDASATDLNASNTATGVMSVERDANVVTADTEYEHVQGIESVLALAVEHTLVNMDPIEMRFNPKTNAIVTLHRDDIRNLKRKVRLLVTKSRSTQQQQMNQQAEAVWLRYMRLNPNEQFIGRPFYVNQLKSLEQDNVDALLPAVTAQQAQQYLEAQAEAAKQQKPPAKTISTKFTDLERSEQEQVLQGEGIKPASPEEVATSAAAESAADTAKKLHEQPPVVANKPK